MGCNATQGDRLHFEVFGGDGVRLTSTSLTNPVDSTEMTAGGLGSTFTVTASKVGAKDKDSAFRQVACFEDYWHQASSPCMYHSGQSTGGLVQIPPLMNIALANG